MKYQLTFRRRAAQIPVDVGEVLQRSRCHRVRVSLTSLPFSVNVSDSLGLSTFPLRMAGMFTTVLL